MEAIFYNGVEAKAHHVTLSFGHQALQIKSTELDPNFHRPAFSYNWEYVDIRITGNPRDGLPIRLTNKNDSNARLQIDDKETWEKIYETLKQHRKQGFYIPLNMTLIIGLCILAIGITIGAYTGLPHLVKYAAPHVNEDLKTAISDLAIEQVIPDAKTCQSKAGTDALETIKTKLVTASNIDYPHPLMVVEHKMVNAIALPDGRIIIFSALIEKATSADEVAAVIAHELGHVYENHVVEGMLRAIGTHIIASLLLGIDSQYAGGQEFLNAFIHSSYQRDMERDADRIGIEILEKANLPTKGMLTFFKNLEDQEPDIPDFLNYLSTHPTTKERIDTIQALTEEDDNTAQPALSETEWQALKTICK